MFKLLLIKSEDYKKNLSLKSKDGEARKAFNKEEGETPFYTLDQFLENISTLISYNKFSQVLVDDDTDLKYLLEKISDEGYLPLATTIEEERWIYLPSPKEFSKVPEFVFHHFHPFSYKYLITPLISEKDLNKVKEFLVFSDLEQKKLTKHLSHLKDGDGEAVKSFLSNAVRNFYVSGHLLSYKIDHSLDWIRSTHRPENASINKDLSSLSLDLAYQKAEDWQKKMNEKAKKFKDDPEDVKLVLEFSSDLALFHLLTPKAKDREGAVMGHCVGGHAYDDHQGIYSIRSLSDNDSHVTFEIKGEMAAQIKGKENGPVAKKYLDAMFKALKFLEIENIYLSEMGYASLVEVSHQLITFISPEDLLHNKYALKTTKFDHDALFTALKDGKISLELIKTFDLGEDFFLTIFEQNKTLSLMDSYEILATHGYTKEIMSCKDKISDDDLFNILNIAIVNRKRELVNEIASAKPELLSLKYKFHMHMPLYLAIDRKLSNIAIDLAKIDPSIITSGSYSDSDNCFSFARSKKLETLCLQFLKIKPYIAKIMGYFEFEKIVVDGLDKLAVAYLKLDPDLIFDDRSSLLFHGLIYYKRFNLLLKLIEVNSKILDLSFRDKTIRDEINEKADEKIKEVIKDL